MRLTRRRAIATIAVTLVAGLLGGPTWLSAGAKFVPAPRSDQAAVAKTALTPTQRHSGVAGWLVIDLDTGEVVDQSHADTAFAPASVAKLPTTFYALDRLGPEYRFETKIAITGKISGQTLDGDLILVGDGDPELDTDDLLPLVTQATTRGFRHVTGQFLVDGSAAPHLMSIDGGQPVDAAYNPSISGLSLNFNRVRLKWDARGETRELRVSAKAARLDPEVAGVRVLLADATGGPMFSHEFAGRDEIWRMNESGFRGEGARWLPVRQPELYCGEILRGLAQTYGIALDPARLGQAPEGAEVIARHQSRALQPMLRSMLRYSTNLTAELVGLAASRANGARPMALAASAAAMNAWAAEVAGFPPGDPGFRLTNHSGLAVDSRVSPRRLVELLSAIAKRQPATAEGGSRLPGGISELLRDYNVAVKTVKLDYANLDIAAKTGTMDYVRGLAGYIVTPSGRRLVFAIFSNDLDRREAGRQRINKGWMAQAREFERGLIRNWVLALEG